MLHVLSISFSMAYLFQLYLVNSISYEPPYSATFSSLLVFHPLWVVLSTLFSDTLSLCSSIIVDRPGITTLQNKEAVL
jgi:hypothetical protein